MRLLRQIERLQAALWRSAEADGSDTAHAAAVQAAVRFDLDACATPTSPDGDGLKDWPSSRRDGWMRRRSRKPLGPRTYRTRPDPFAGVWSEVEQLLAADPEQTARSVFAELARRHPGVYPEGQLRTLQRRVAEWRARTLLVFDDTWLAEEPLAGKQWPPPLLATAIALIATTTVLDDDRRAIGVQQ